MRIKNMPKSSAPTIHSFEECPAGLYENCDGQRFLIIKNAEHSGPKTMVFFICKEGEMHYNPLYVNYAKDAVLISQEITLTA